MEGGRERERERERDLGRVVSAVEVEEEEQPHVRKVLEPVQRCKCLGFRQGFIRPKAGFRQGLGRV